MVRNLQRIFFVLCVFQVLTVQGQRVESNTVRASGGATMTVLGCGASVFACMQNIQKSDDSCRKKEGFLCSQLKQVYKNCCNCSATKAFLDKSFLAKKEFAAQEACSLAKRIMQVCATSPACVEGFVVAIAGKKSKKIGQQSIKDWPVDLRKSLNICCKDKNFQAIDIRLLQSLMKKNSSIPLRVKEYCQQEKNK